MLLLSYTLSFKKNICQLMYLLMRDANSMCNLFTLAAVTDEWKTQWMFS